MAALKEIAREYASEIRDGIGWVIVYRTGRSWNALTVWSDLGNNEWETDDINDALKALRLDPRAVALNGYYLGHFGDMTIDDIAAGIRWHYERGTNALADDDTLMQARPTSKRPGSGGRGRPPLQRAGMFEGPEDEINPYTYDGSMTVADYEAAQRARDAHAALVEVAADHFPDAAEEVIERIAEVASSMKLSPEAVQRILDAFDNIIEVINRMIEWAVWAAKTIVNTIGRAFDDFLLCRPRPSGATTPSTRSGPASARNTATASGGPSSLRWLRKGVEAREVQVRRLRALLECEHIPADPPRRLHLPAL